MKIDRTISNLPSLRGIPAAAPSDDEALRPIADAIRLTPLDTRPFAAASASNLPKPVSFDDKGNFVPPVTYGMSAYGKVRDDIRSREKGTQVSLYA